MSAKKAQRALLQQVLISHSHDSLQLDRLTKYSVEHRHKYGGVNAERVYAARWKHENRRRPGINSGYAALEWILCPSKQRTPSPVSRRDVAVAASVIQWLGTNCGSAFVLGCERKVAELRAATGSRWMRQSVFELLKQDQAVIEAAGKALGDFELARELARKKPGLGSKVALASARMALDQQRARLTERTGGARAFRLTERRKR